jgi:hypothetical protein
MESSAKTVSGYVALFFASLLLANAWLIYYMAMTEVLGYLWFEIPFCVATFIVLFGFFVVQPNEARALVLFGEYIGSVRGGGFWWANQLTQEHCINE